MALDQATTASSAQMAVSGAAPCHGMGHGEARGSAAALRDPYRPGADRHDLSTMVDLGPGTAAALGHVVAARDSRCTQPA